MNGLLLHHGACLLVCDGRKALFLVNEGHPGHEKLAIVQEHEQKLASHSADLGTDRPSLTRQVSSGSAGSAIEDTDRHSAQEDQFLRTIVGEFATFMKDRKADQAVLVAPPRALASLRKHASEPLLAQTVAQIDKDLTKHPLAEMSKILLG
jgi:protein required for attachment to host cells